MTSIKIEAEPQDGIPKNEIDALKAQLLERRKELIQSINQHLHGQDEPNRLAFANYLESAGDWGEANTLADMDVAITSHDLAELKEIDAALYGIASQNYGSCTQCGNGIPIARLRAQPSTRFCVSCMKALEKRT
ncbi:TraR/DksA C4-type zinc finger protein [Oxalobacteraceae bacterium R-40]|uniref:TraR/DksA C4-type zinc finger protein n=1 Tax=Keguizhuia sedimenti TaxID=3064264 RepID=A0ABU1BP24_9BURK|nr:TraR/DksA C4-type zinc finger protein [Oxalobacteraceae bacterium R-40]